MSTFFRKLSFLLGPAAKLRAIFLFGGLLFGALLEAVGIGLILPFISLMSDPQASDKSAILRWFSDTSNITANDQLLLVGGLLLICVFLLKNLYLGWLYFFKNKFAFEAYVDLTHRLLGKYIHSPYRFHIQRNSAEMLRTIDHEAIWVVMYVLLPGLQLLSEILVVLAITAVLFIAAPVATPIALVLLSLTGAIFLWFIRRKTSELGEAQQEYRSEMIKWVNQSLNAIKELKISGKESFFLERHHKSTERFGNTRIYYHTVKSLPRLFLETVGAVVLLGGCIIAVKMGHELQALIPLLGLFGMASMRLLPSANRIIAALTSLRFYASSVHTIHADLLRANETPTPPATAAKKQALDRFENAIELRSVQYTYPEEPEPALRDINLEIRRGNSVAFVGASGAGKSTLVDLILGLLRPDSGDVLVDGNPISSALARWRNQISYVPQQVYLLDDTIRRNVAFGTKDDVIDDSRIWEVLEMARLATFVRRLPGGLDTNVGEDAIKMSGGQRQRLGIARALYPSPEVLVLDEATSALDGRTESEIASAVEELRGQMTLLIIAHRHSTIVGCDKLFVLADGELIGTGTYEELQEGCEPFQKLNQTDNQTGGSSVTSDTAKSDTYGA